MTSFTPIPPGARPAPSPPVSDRPLTEGPRWYRTRLRTFGPLAALIVPAIVGGIAYLSLRLFDTPWSGAVGLIGGVFAAPALLAAGAPFGDRSLYPLAVAASGLLWLLVGFLAARRATRNPMATWADFWRHYAWMCAGVWTGAAIALGAAALSISDSLF
ncbi:MAG TPA: hypothetical protein VLN74_07730 [Ilumatobacteraceae bacterium]|nr:hypothetical protein [Ilumatobacteraceae bacterium]